MKWSFLFVILAIISASCSVARKSKADVIRITVTDKQNYSPVDSAKVILTSIIDSRDVSEYVKYTDNKGHCSFSPDYNASAQFQVRTMKKGFTGYFDESYPDLDRSFSFINKKTGNSIVLYLTSDTLNQINYWASHATRFDIDTLINLM
jgi:hypothetical protein